MAYRDDADLAFLGSLSSQELNDLVNILIFDKDGDARLTENLTYSEKYKAYSPDHKMYWEEIAEELQLFGGNTFMNLLKGNKGVLYKEILCDVCDKLKVNYNKKADTLTIEQNLLMKILQDSLDKMSAEEIKDLAEALHLDNHHLLTAQALSATFLAIFKAGGLKSYQLTAVVVNAVMVALFGRGIALTGNVIAGRVAGILAGPIGWIMTGIWAAIDIAGPAYRITIPAVIQVAYLRSLSANRPAVEKEHNGQESDQSTEKAKSKGEEESLEEQIIQQVRNKLYNPNNTNFKRVISLISRAENWANEDKQKMMNAVYYSRTGMNGWDYIGPESTEVIWELAKTEKLREVYQQAAALLPDCEEAQNLNNALTLAEKRRQSWIKPTYKRNQTPSVTFADFGFKLLVVNELMFNQTELTPKFELQAFLDEDSEKCINARTNEIYKAFAFGLFNPFLEVGGLSEIPNLPKSKQIYHNTFDAVFQYFNNLDIKVPSLLKIEHLEMNRSMPLYKNMLVVLGNGEMALTDTTIKDLDLLPNLKSISVSSEVNLADTFQTELKRRGIDLVISQDILD